MNRSRLRITWPLTAMFSAYPLWWVLGLSGFSWLIIAIPMVAIIIGQHRSRVPAAFVLWLAFLGWVLLSGVQITSGKTDLTFGYRFGLYLAGTVLFIFVYNLPRSPEVNARVLRILTVFWMIVVAGGYAGILLHSFSFTPPLDYLLPHGLRSQPFVQQLVEPVFAEVQSFLGYPIPRPAAPFTYTNNWGGIIAVLTFVALASITSTQSKRWRRLVLVVLVLSVVPMAFSLNRGMFLSIGVGIVYIVVRLAARGRARALATMLTVTALALAVLVLTPLGGLVTASFSSSHGQSNSTRANLYKQASSGAAASPIFGYGGPKLQAGQTSGAAVGTQGQLWVVLYSDGYPALVLFLGFFVAVLWQTRRAPGTAGLCLNTVPVVGLTQIVVYGWLPAELQVIMVAAALTYRMCGRRRAGEPDNAPAESHRRSEAELALGSQRYRQVVTARATDHRSGWRSGLSPAQEQ
jgi:polysaccharide biosynthesis protein PslJ